MNALLEQGTKGHGLSQCPVGRARLNHFHASFQDTLDTLVHNKLRSVRRRGAEALADVHQRLLKHAGVGRLEKTQLVTSQSILEK